MALKKIGAILLTAVVLCTSFMVSAFAATPVENEISPYYEIAGMLQSNLSISGQTAYCTSEGSGTDAVKITVEQYLEKQGFLWLWFGVDDASWTTTVYRSAISFYNTKYNLSNGKYRLKSVFTLTDSTGKTETLTIYSSEKQVG